MIKNKTYILPSNSILTNEVLKYYISQFWNEEFTPIQNGPAVKHLMVLCKVKYSGNEEVEGNYKTLGPLRRVEFKDLELFFEYLIGRLGIIVDSYDENIITEIIFTYVVKEGEVSDKDRLLLEDLSDKEIKFHEFNKLILPLSMNPSDYGTIRGKTPIGDNIRYFVRKGNRVYEIDVSLDKLINKVSIIGSSDLNWIDTKISDNLFKRDIGKSSNFFIDGVRVLRKKELSAKPFTKLSTDKTLANNFVTMDIETIKLESKIKPYLICAYNGTDYISTYADESLNQKSLVSSFIYQLVTFFTKDSNVLVVYAHNLSGFDGTFILKYLLEFGKVEPILFNGKLMSIKVRLNIEGYIGKTIIFKDSYLLLPLSLRKLCAAFNVPTHKGYFPFNFTNVFYAGILPAFECWSGISKKVYNNLLSEYKGKIWNYELEAIKYCKLDCKCLHEILVEFNNLIYSIFTVNIHKSLTLPSLAMRIYKSQFMPKNTIFKLNGKAEFDIRQSYTGGAVDVYVPHNRRNIDTFFSKLKVGLIKLFYYDVNSLYPFVMANTAMPVGKPVAFEGDIRKIDPNAYGFFYCKITSPEYLEHPILQRRIKTSEGIRTIAGLGQWEGWIYSAEMDNAIKHKYQFEIIRGYEFKQGFIFREYVEKMYNLRMQYDKGHPLNLIAKLLMNSLYGKFGMKLEKTIVEMFNTSNDADNELLNNMLDTYGMTLQDFIKIDDKLLTVRNSILNPFGDDSDDDLYHEGADVSVAIAAAVTAGGRMWMSLLKNNPKINLFYSDTDSGVVDSPLPESIVGPMLGQFKLEHVIKRAVFLAPKVYGLITDEGEEIIKVKGIKSEMLKDINIKTLEALLFQDETRVFTQEKWMKNYQEGNITFQDLAYTLKITSNKRSSVYVEKIFNSTKPLHYDNIK